MVVKFLSPEDHCRTLMTNIQSSNLTYLTQETPYSLYVTIRKKFTKAVQPNTNTPDPAQSRISEETPKIDILGLKVKSLEASNNILKSDLFKKSE